MDDLRGSMGSIADLVAGAAVLTWAAPTVCEVFGPGFVAGSVEREWKGGVE
jgi:hypothetical protein